MVPFNCPEVFKGRFPQFIAVFTATVSAISDGMQYGWSAPIIPILQSKDTPVPIHESDIVWLENIYMLGSLIGLPFTIYTVDKFGRKKSILLAAALNVVGWILIGVASTVEMLYIARLITGIAANVSFVSTPMYIAEIADEKIRGFLGCFIYLMGLVGILVVYAVAPFVAVSTSSVVGAAFLILQLATFSFMPESPYYLLLQGQKEEAKKSLQRLRVTKDVNSELEEISNAIERQQSEKGRIIDLVIVGSNRKALIILTVLNAAQHFSSISVMLMNVHTILTDAESVLPPNTAALIFSAVMLVAAFSSACLVDKVGRKTLLSSSSFLTGISLLLLASYFAVKNAGVDITPYNWVPVVVVMIYAATFKLGLGMVPIVMLGELFPTSVKAMGMTVADLMYSIFSAISIYLHQFLAIRYGMHVPFFVFAASCLLTTLFTIFYIPETKGKTLEEIQLVLKGKKANQNDSKNIGGHVNEAMDNTVC